MWKNSSFVEHKHYGDFKMNIEDESLFETYERRNDADSAKCKKSS